jgi:hypothetical protein
VFELNAIDEPPTNATVVPSNDIAPPEFMLDIFSLNSTFVVVPPPLKYAANEFLKYIAPPELYAKLYLNIISIFIAKVADEFSKYIPPPLPLAAVLLENVIDDRAPDIAAKVVVAPLKYIPPPFCPAVFFEKVIDVGEKFIWFFIPSKYIPPPPPLPPVESLLLINSSVPAVIKYAYTFSKYIPAPELNATLSLKRIKRLAAKVADVVSLKYIEPPLPLNDVFALNAIELAPVKLIVTFLNDIPPPLY